MLSESLEYAIRALVFIQLQNANEKRPGILEIADQIGASKAYSAEILQKLTQNQLVDSQKGRLAEFFFKEGKCELSLLDVILALEGPDYFHKCGFGLKNCDQNNPCPLHDDYKGIRDGFLDMVKNESIHSLAQKIKDGKAVLNRIRLN
ncbi:MAG TPA: Rrf2 family transcriptional regulator [Sunxiuqinia sp.]|nr:Rrf2 family transcriptional regulator [Sunxiuqinia sp.]